MTQDPKDGRGGARKGAGRKPVSAVQTTESDPQAFLIRVMQGLIAPSPAQLSAAIAAARNQSSALGKKGKQKADAATVATGKFTPGFAPKLVQKYPGSGD